MTRNDKLIRDTDKKIFKVVDLAHWSTILAEDGEEDHVKWYGGIDDQLYVSANKGFGYKVVKS